jgi:hypothetical protein
MRSSVITMSEDTGRLEVQGLVNLQGEPIVQFRQVVNGEVVARWQAPPADAREMAQLVVEAAMNAVYDAAIWSWAKETWPSDPKIGAAMLEMVRKHRADTWGLPDQPEDWRDE